MTVAYKTGRKIVIALVGFTLVLFGIILIFIPGPALLVIPFGLAVLGLEFSWARRWLAYLKERGMDYFKQDQKAEKTRNKRL